MSTKPVTMVRIYLTEGMQQYQQIVELLHDQEQVAGVTAFRGITGFGQSGKIHSSSLLDMSLDLPMILEFFDEPEKIESVLKHLNSLIKPGHIVSWPANVNSGE
jgi:PII-like signaling protein